MSVQEPGAAHGHERGVATIELELEAEELRALMQPVARMAGGANGPQHDVTEAAQPTTCHRQWLRRSFGSRRAGMALLVSASAAAILLAVGHARVARAPAVATLRVASVARAPVVQRAVLPKQRPVRFANPFDAAEVFEFPAGTSRSAAREAVAKFLTERARGRLYSLRAKRARHHRSPRAVNAGSVMQPASSPAA